MLNTQSLMITPFVEELQSTYSLTYGSSESDYGEILGWASHFVLHNLSNCNALYHDLEHTMMVTAVGQEILKGKQLSEGGITPKAWLQFMLALLCHDIGYMPGICEKDTETHIVINDQGESVELDTQGTHAFLTPYHVDRGKIFIRERFAGNKNIDSDKVADYIEMTRFPVPNDNFHKDTSGLKALVRAADFIGQLGDPNYLRKLPALFYEFEELDRNKELGYKNPQDMRNQFATFYWGYVRPYVEQAFKYLRVTQEGRQWIANLHSHVFDVEHKEEA